MDKYVGRFRVVRQKDMDGNLSDNVDDTYIKCKKGIQIYRYNSDLLAVYIPSLKRGRNYVALLDKYTERIEESDIEVTFYFKEEHIDVITEVVQPIVSGKDIKPTNKTKSKEKLTENDYLEKFNLLKKINVEEDFRDYFRDLMYSYGHYNKIKINDIYLHIRQEVSRLGYTCEEKILDCIIDNGLENQIYKFMMGSISGIVENNEQVDA